MGTKDYLTLFKISLLKAGWSLFFLLVWFGLLFYLPKIGEDLSPDLAKNLAYFQQFITKQESWPIPFNILALIIWMIAFVLLKELTERLIDYTKRASSYKLAAQNKDKDWIYNGKTKFLLNPSRLKVNSSRAGCLLKNKFWKNFIMHLEMKFLDNNDFIIDYSRSIGIVFRALDLENYFMLEISVWEKKDGNGKKTGEGALCIKPHVRYQGMWDAMNQDIISRFKSVPFWLDDWIKIRITLKNNIVALHINEFEEYIWVLPTHVDINHIEAGIKQNQNISSNQGDQFAAKVTYLPEIPFKDSFGMIGFRAHLDQGAEIKDLTIKSI